MATPTNAASASETAPADASGVSTSVPIPEGVDRATTIEQIKVRRRSPEQGAVKYDGSNAVQVAAWLLGHGRRCQVSFDPIAPPVLLTDDGTPIRTGWVLPNLEVITSQDLTTIWEQVPDA